MDGIRTEGTEDLQQLAAALKEAADHDLTNRVRKSMRDIAKPVGQTVVREGALRMPRRGGFSGRVAGQSKVGVTSAIASRTVHVTLTFRNKGSDLRSLDAGLLRHPVFARSGHPRVWTRQSVPSKAFSTPFEAQAPVVRRAVLDAMQGTLSTAAGKVRH